MKAVHDSARLSPEGQKLAAGVRAGERSTLARAITLIESKRADHRTEAHHLVQELLPFTGKAIRVGSLRS